MRVMKERRRALALLVLAVFAILCIAVPAMAEEGESFADTIANTSHYYNTFWALVPSLVAIILALITKEVYSSLFIGIVFGAILAANGNFEMTLNTVFSNGIVASVADSYNVGILIFLVILGAIVAMMNKAGDRKSVV